MSDDVIGNAFGKINVRATAHRNISIMIGDKKSELSIDAAESLRNELNSMIDKLKNNEC